MCKRIGVSGLGRRIAAGVVALLLTTGPTAAQDAPSSTASAARPVQPDANGYGGEVSLALGGSQILTFDQPVGRVFLGSPEIGDVIPLNDHALYVLGKKTGSTSLTVMRRGHDARPIAMLDLHIGVDVAGLARNLKDLLPGEAAAVRSGGDGVVLSGEMSSSAAAAAALSLAERYAPGKVVNLTSVAAAEQVMLSVRVAEVQRSALQKLGVTGATGLWDRSGSITLTPGALDPNAFARLLGRTTAGAVSIDVVVDALERKGVASILAEPTLVALSGETANFFAGGEFPVPVAQNVDNGKVQTTIEFKPYGVNVGFTPTVNGRTINLAISSEVSAIDKENAVVAQGFSIPAISTRRAKTTIELRDGQSFAIAGLIQRDFTDSVRGLPGASKIPLLGALLRSSGFQKQETEVLIVVTPHLAHPTATPPKLPTDTFRAPAAPALLLEGKVEASAEGRP